ncbi:MAG: nucleoside triphosphate pyrophosphohydrolase [Hyphomonas sp.]|jgi:ATP diphosphatase|nr:nucleoside triphosphate pyrophosphohydrolase [Hyphomonas sp.]
MTLLPPTPPFTLASLAAILADLRNPNGGCPWDMEQDFATIAPYTIEEAYEVADAIERNDMPALKDELGDLLLQVVYHSQIATERGAFTVADVVAAVCAKMIRRHPHVYAAPDGRTADGQVVAWEEQKAVERGDARTLDGVALALPALQRAQKLQKRAARVGFDWPDAQGPRAKISEELQELEAAGSAEQRHHELGDLLFSVVNLARHLGVDAEAALRDANGRFQRRFEIVEDLAGEALSKAPLAQLVAWWDTAKQRAG